MYRRSLFHIVYPETLILLFIKVFIRFIHFLPFFFSLTCEDLGNTSLKPGYQSHYVCTSQTGFPINEINNTTEMFGEIIINQEEQVVPAYILILEPNQPYFDQLGKEIQRLPLPPSIPSPSTAPIKGLEFYLTLNCSSLFILLLVIFAYDTQLFN